MTAVDDLRKALHRLTKPTTRRVALAAEAVQSGGPAHVHAMVPSLLDQLDEAAEQGGQSGGARGVFGSRSPTGDDVLMVRLLIAAEVARRRVVAGLEPGLVLSEALTGLAEHLIAAVNDQTKPDVDEATVAELAGAAEDWARQATAVLRIEWSARELLGAPCPKCFVTWIPGQDGLRAAALIILFGDGGYVRASQCRRCGAVWWRGEGQGALGEYTQARDDAQRAHRRLQRALEAAQKLAVVRDEDDERRTA